MGAARSRRWALIGALALAALVAAPGARAADLALRESGRGATTVVLIHGNYDDQGTWAAVAPRLAQHFRVVTLDLPGFGQAPDLDGEATIEAKAEAVAQALTKAGVRRAVLVGHSYGGAVAAAFAAAHPERVAGLVLEGANFVPSQAAPQAAQAVGRVLSAAAGGDAAAIEAAVREALPRVLLAPGAVSDQTVARIAGAVGPQRLPALRRAAGAFAVDGLPEWLAFSHARRPFPVLAVWGLEDPLVPVAGAEAVATAVPEARLVILGATGHAPHLERPDAFAQAVVGAFGPKATWPPEDRYLHADGARLASGAVLPRVRAAIERHLAEAARAGCAAKDVPACRELAERLARGLGVARDVTAATALSEHLCRAGDAESCLAVAAKADDASVRRAAARALRRCRAPKPSQCASAAGLMGRLAEARPERMPTLLERGCGAGEAAACLQLALPDLAIEAGPEGWARALGPLDKACQAGLARACTLQGDTLARNGLRDVGVTGDPRPLLERACAQGDGAGCERLADDLRFGAEHPRSVRLSRLACVLGHAEGCLQAGRFLSEGRGAPVDPAGAAALAARACVLGSAEGCLDRDRLAGLANDRARHASDLAARCAEGLAVACAVAGERYLGLDGSPSRPKRAAEVLRRGCDLGARDACTLFGALLRDGRGVARDAKKATALLDQACTDGEDAACVHLAILERERRKPAAAEAALARVRSVEGQTALARRLQVGDRLPRDPVRARALLTAACRAGGRDACGSPWP